MENHQRKCSNSFNIDDTSCNDYMSSDFDLYKRKLKRSEMLNIECNQEWSRNMDLLLYSGWDINYIYNEFVNMYDSMFNNFT